MNEGLAAALADRYRLVRELGQGGMATVYLAEDLRHHRKVAVKVLRPELSAILGTERFLHEITTTANLQHPHILSLFDSGEAQGRVFYVMPYVEGESLRDRLARTRQLPVDEAVRIASEVADALGYAHRHGVIHRDIKPENILLHDGHVQVADFGIALAVSRSDGGTRMTETGMSLGTPHYMSPEQAMGEREISAASDIYALGCVAYEMLAGEPPFTGPTAQAIVARVMTEDPRSLTLQRKTVPLHVEDAVLTALAKLPADRFATAQEFAAALTGAGTGLRRAAPITTRRPGPAGSRSLLLALGVLALVTTGLAAWGFLRPAPPGPVSWFSINLPPALRVSPFIDPALALSPDGRTLAYTAEAGGVVIRRLDDPRPVQVAGTEEGGSSASFSDDGAMLLFLDRFGRPRKATLGSGSSVSIPLQEGIAITQIRWRGTDDYAVTLRTGALGLLRADGWVDTLVRLDAARNEATIDVMQTLPNGEILAIATTSFPEGDIITVDPKTGQRHLIPLTAKANWAAFAAGRLIWSLSDGSIHAAPFSLSGRRLEGAPVSLNALAQITRGFRPKVAASANGAIALVQAPLPTMVQVDRSGKVRTLLTQPRVYHNPRVSPDGRRLSFDVAGNDRDVWAYDFRDTTLTRLSFEGDGHDAFWMPNGTGLYFAAAKQNLIGIYRRNADGSGTPDSVLTDGVQISIHGVTPDGRTGIAARIDGFTFDLVTIDLTAAERKAVPLVATRFNELYPALSPDGRWLAYVTDETNSNEVYVRPFPGPGSKAIVSQGGGSEPIWSRDGRELFYRGTDPEGPRLIAARVETSPAFRVLSRASLFDDTDYEGSTPHANYDVMPDGQSFVMVRQGRFAEVTYVANWLTTLDRGAKGGR